MVETLVWILPRPRLPYYRGGFPLHFEKKLWRELGCPKKVLHPFGGMAEIGDRVDINPEVNPNYIGDAHNLDFIKDNSYDLVILDPPYSDKMAENLYKTPPIKIMQCIREAVRVCKSKGFIAIYHWLWIPRPKGTKYYKRIVVLYGQWHRARICGIFQKEL